MDKMMKECMKPHALAHMVTGFGLALVVVALWPSIGAMGLWLGVVVVVVGMVWDMSVNPAKK
ncbi:hypothetical protein HY407_05350 [Candidatus Gottesmanbacteria bacterium]|nr:hypothetical protein [Candidatus Gottesmanbacteria bacterium]